MTLLKSESVTTAMPVIQLSPLHDFQPPSHLIIKPLTGRAETHAAAKEHGARNLFVSQPFSYLVLPSGKQESEKVE